MAIIKGFRELDSEYKFDFNTDSCYKCKEFHCFQDDSDLLEDNDHGRCYHDENEDMDDFVGVGTICEYFDKDK